MVTIEPLTEQPHFTIKTVCEQTGILPVTLRAWERRHELLIPYRSGNRYRLYSDNDIAVIRWVKNRVDSGISISNAVKELHNLQRGGVLPDTQPLKTLPQSTPTQNNLPPEPFIRELFQALIKHDESAASGVFQHTVSRYDLLTLFSKILTPVLVEIGEAWYRGEILITTEHFASAFLRGRLLALHQAYPARNTLPYLMVGCAPNELHEIGSLMFAVLLRANGFRVEFLGPDLPLRDLVDYASYERPTMIILSATSAASAIELAPMQSMLARIKQQPLFGFGGGAFNLNRELRYQIPGQFLGETFEECLNTTLQLVKRPDRPVLV